MHSIKNVTRTAVIEMVKLLIFTLNFVSSGKLVLYWMLRFRTSTDGFHLNLRAVKVPITPNSFFV